MNLLKRTTTFFVVTLLLGTAGCTKSSSDAEITGRVKTAISKEPGLKETKVNVSTKENVVHLGGTVNSRAERAMLISVARRVDGVKAVNTDLVVAPQQNAGTKPIKPQQNAGNKPQQKPRDEARVKQEPPAQVQVRATPPGAGVPPER
jgi:transglutaminase/protease-like cytokinesis protein 3